MKLLNHLITIFVELCRLAFSDQYRDKSISDKSDIFFSDYQLIPLLIQENYLQCQPHTQKKKLTDLDHLNLIAKAADSISLGDICSQMIFSRNESWSLLPYQVTDFILFLCCLKTFFKGHLFNCCTMFVSSWSFTWYGEFFIVFWSTFSNE
jgi:hypothetical protein